MIATEQMPNVEFDVTVLRPATAEDHYAVRGMFFDYLCEVAKFGHDIDPIRQNADWYWENVFLPEIKRHGDTNMIVIATRDGMAIAALFWALAPEGTAMNRAVIDHGVWVRPVNRGEHLGGRLQQHAVMLAKHHGATAVFSSVLMNNKWGIASAKKLGCEFTGYTTKLKL